MTFGLSFKTNIMENLSKQLKISNISFESNNNEVLVQGLLNKGMMSYETDLIITHTQLNIILNCISGSNPNFDLNESLITEIMFDSTNMYKLDLTNLANNSIDLNLIETIQPFRQIRA